MSHGSQDEHGIFTTAKGKKLDLTAINVLTADDVIMHDKSMITWWVAG